MVGIAIFRIAFGKARGIAETSRVEEGMRLVNTRVNVSDLNTRPSNGSATRGIPSIRRIDDLVALTQVGMINGVVLSALYHRRGCNRLQRRSVKFNRDCIERYIVFARYLCLGRISSQPSSEFVTSSG